MYKIMCCGVERGVLHKDYRAAELLAELLTTQTGKLHTVEIV